MSRLVMPVMLDAGLMSGHHTYCVIRAGRDRRVRTPGLGGASVAAVAQALSFLHEDLCEHPGKLHGPVGTARERKTAPRRAAWTDIEHVYVAGHSTGGLTALLLASQESSRILSFIDIEGNPVPRTASPAADSSPIPRLTFMARQDAVRRARRKHWRQRSAYRCS